MPLFIKKRWVLALVLLVFIIAKIPNLFTAFYWDESWPYATAVHRMYLHGVSLLPNALQPDYSRGHPLFFHASAATWMNIFGTSNAAIHCFALFISVCLLITMYEMGLKLFNERVAALAIVLMVLQVMFFVQSAFILPEVMVAFLSFLSLYVYVTTDKYLLKALTLCALFLTKESGVFVGFVIGIDAMVRLLNNKIPLKNRILDFASVSFAVAVTGLFFIVQKYYNGWYLFPLHDNLMEKRWDMFFWHFRDALLMLFHYEHRYYYYILLAILSILAAIIKRNARYVALLLPAIIIYGITSDAYWQLLPSYIYFPLLIVALFTSIYLLSSTRYHNNSLQVRMIYLVAGCLLSFVVLSCCNLLLKRYLMTAVALLMFFTAVYLDMLAMNVKKYFFQGTFAIVLAIGCYCYISDTGFGDNNLGAFSALRLQEKLVSYCEEKKFYNEVIGAGSYLDIMHLRDPYTGFLTSRDTFNVSWGIDNHTTMAIFDNVDSDFRYESFKKDTSFHLVGRVSEKKFWAEFYKRK